MTTLTLPRVRGAAERAFYTGMALAILAAVFLGFAPGPLPPGLVRPRGAPGDLLPARRRVHRLVRAARRPGLPRRPGTHPTCTAASGQRAPCSPRGDGGNGDGGDHRGPSPRRLRRGVDLPPLRFLAIPLFDMVLFGLLVGIAVARQRDPQPQRLMLVASVAIITAAGSPLALPLHEGRTQLGFTDLFLGPALDLGPRDPPPAAPGHDVGRPGARGLAAAAPLGVRHRGLDGLREVGEVSEFSGGDVPRRGIGQSGSSGGGPASTGKPPVGSHQ